MTVLSNIWTNETTVIRKVRQGPVLVCQTNAINHTQKKHKIDNVYENSQEF